MYLKHSSGKLPLNAGLQHKLLLSGWQQWKRSWALTKVKDSHKCKVLLVNIPSQGNRRLTAFMDLVQLLHRT